MQAISVVYWGPNVLAIQTVEIMAETRSWTTKVLVLDINFCFSMRDANCRLPLTNYFYIGVVGVQSNRITPNTIFFFFFFYFRQLRHIKYTSMIVTWVEKQTKNFRIYNITIIWIQLPTERFMEPIVTVLIK